MIRNALSAFLIAAVIVTVLFIATLWAIVNLLADDGKIGPSRLLMSSISPDGSLVVEVFEYSVGGATLGHMDSIYIRYVSQKPSHRILLTEVYSEGASLLDPSRGLRWISNNILTADVGRKESEMKKSILITSDPVDLSKGRRKIELDFY